MRQIQISLCAALIGVQLLSTPPVSAEHLVRGPSRIYDITVLSKTFPAPPEIAAAKSKGDKGSKGGSGKKKPGKPVDAAGFYSGVLTLAKVKTFKGFQCTPTQAFPAEVLVSQVKKNVSSIINNLPVTLNGRAKEKSAGMKGSLSIEAGIKRTYNLIVKRVKSGSAEIVFKETVKQGKKKACRFTHSGAFSRVQ